MIMWKTWHCPVVCSLKETVVQLEERIEALEAAAAAAVERAQASERERGRRREMRRARSVPGRDSNMPAAAEFRGLPSLGTGQDAVVAGLQLRLEVQRGRCRRAEEELAALVAENRELRAKMHEVIANAAHQTLGPAVNECSRDKTESSNEAVCAECKKPISAPQPFSEPYEHDLDELPSGSGKFVRLKNGGSAFGSRDSLYRIGLEPDDTTPGREVCSAILAASFQTAQSEEKSKSDTAGGGSGGSILAELEEQYRRLVVRYESLIEAKTSSANHSGAAKSDDAGAGRPRDLNLPSSDPTEGHFDRGPPEYKRLFSEIFKTLRRSAEYPPLTSPQAKADWCLSVVCNAIICISFDVCVVVCCETSQHFCLLVCFTACFNFLCSNLLLHFRGFEV